MLTRREFLSGASAAALLLGMPEQSIASLHGSIGGGGGGGGAANLNGSVFNVANPVFNNLAKAFPFAPFMNNQSANGYPVAAPATNQYIVITTDQSYYGQYVLKWTGTGAFFMGNGILIYSGDSAIQNGKTTTGSLVSTGGNTTINGATGAGASSPRIVFSFGFPATNVFKAPSTNLIRISSPTGYIGSPYATGQTVKVQNVGGQTAANGTWVYTIIDAQTIELQGSSWNAGTPYTSGGEIINPVLGASTSWVFPTNGTYSSFDGFVLCKAANESAVTAGQIFDAAYMAQLQYMRPAYLRFMDSTQCQGSWDADFSLRQNKNYICYTGGPSYTNPAYVPTPTAGINIFHGASDAYTCADPSNSTWSGSSYIDGAIVQGVVDVTNAGTLPTLNVGGHGAKPIINKYLKPFDLILSAPSSAGLNLVVRFTASYFSGGHYDFPYTTVAGDVGNLGAFANNLAVAMANDPTLQAANVVCGNGGAGDVLVYYPAAASGVLTITYVSGPAILTVTTLPANAINTGTDGTTFVYSALLGAWSYAQGGLITANPYEAMVELCNRVGANCWFNWPLNTKQPFIGAVTSFFADSVTGLTSGLKFATEFCNEIWNSAGPIPYPRCNALGHCLGWSEAGTQSALGWQATRTVLYAAESRSAWAAKGRSASDHYILIQAQVDDFSPNSNTQQFIWNAIQTNTTSFPLYGSYGGWAGAAGSAMTANGSRPIDKADGIGFAPYWTTNWFNQTASAIAGTTAVNAPWLTASLNYAQGNTAAAYQAIADQISGVSYNFTQRNVIGGNNYLGYQNRYAGWYARASSYDSYRLGAGLNVLKCFEYEGGSQFAIGGDPTNGTNSATDSISTLASQIAGLGWDVSAYVLSGTNNATECATNVNAMLYNFKFSTQYKTVFKQRYIQSIGAFAGREAHPAQYGYGGPNIWALFPGDPQSSTNYSSYDAIHEFNNTNYHYYEGLVASRARMMHSNQNLNFQFNSRSAHIASENLSAIRVCFQNYWNGTNIGGQLADVGIGAAATITAALEYNGVSTPIWFITGNNSIGQWTIPDGGVLWSAYVGCNIPAGATFWIRTFWNNPNGVIVNFFQNPSLGECIELAASGLSDRTSGTGTFTNTIGWSYPPLAIVGITNNASVIIVGDSIAAGQSDAEDNSTSATGYNAKVGVIARSLGNIPFVNVAVSGEKASTWVSDATARGTIMQNGSHMVCELGLNDILNSATAAQVTANLKTIYALARPGQKIYQTTYTPDTSGSANYSTLVGQTVFAQDSVRMSLNATYRTPPFTGDLAALTGIYDVGGVFDLGNSKWRVDNVSTFVAPYTGDGVHPNGTFSSGYPSGNNGYQLPPFEGVISPVSWP